MRKLLLLLLVLSWAFFSSMCSAGEEPADMKDDSPGVPPYGGTIFLDPDIVVDSDSSVFLNLLDAGQDDRQVFDRRVDAWITINAFLFKASFANGDDIEFRVNPEYGSVDQARKIALFYGPFIGQLPAVLRSDLKSVTIHQGVKPFGGGDTDLLIHAGQGEEYLSDGILEETLIHEASHTSLDDVHAAAPDWMAAQEKDNNFISTYAQDFPKREDIAESFLLYVALTFRRDRISDELAEEVQSTIPNRLAYFDKQVFDMSPIN